MEIIEIEALNLLRLLLKKAKIEDKLKKTFKCFLRKCFVCCGMRDIEQELCNLNEEIGRLRTTPSKEVTRESIRRSRRFSIV